VCQYCSIQHRPNDLTFDHVLPRAAGGVTSWENIATACSPCNMRKDTRLEKPRRKPFEPTVHQLMAAQRHFPPNFLYETWRDFLYWDVELEK